MAQGATLLSYDFATDLTSSVTTYGSADVDLGSSWSLSTGNITAAGIDIDSGVSTTGNGFSISYTISGLAAGETINLTNITYDYTGFANTTRVGAGAAGTPISINPTDGDSSFDYVVNATVDGVAVNLDTGLSNGDTVLIRLGFRDGASADASTYTVDNLVISGDIVPEPSSTALLGLAGVAFILRRKR